MPTGANATMELYEKLVNFARRHNIVIVNDNPYSFILNKKPLSILNVPGAKECCIEFNSMSKSHNMPGWRVGMLATNQVGMFLWGRIPESYNDVEELTEKVLHEARVFITPGFIFGSNGKRYIRISLCAKEEKLAEALERIKKIM